MSIRATICWIAALALVLSMAPSGMAAHHVGPPDETGMGGGDVTDEPNTESDANGLDQCQSAEDFTSCQDSTGTLVLDGVYSSGAYPYMLDYNSVIRAATAENVDTDGDGDHEEFMYPGLGLLTAWWGWWNDKGRGDNLRETGQTVPGVVSGAADGTINDGHDDHQSHDGTIYTGDWDEFVWRGQNPWAGQDNWDSDLGGKPIHDGKTDSSGNLLDGHAPKDTMLAFVDPGTHDNADFAGVETDQHPGALLRNDADDSQRPDFTMTDRTAQSASSPGPYPHNGAGYGWLSDIGWWHYQYDQSLMMATEISYSVNPDTAGSGGSLYDIGSGDKVDVDAYSAIHPEVENLYRATVWDPGNEESSPGDAVHNEGPKQAAKETWSNRGLVISSIAEQAHDTLRPADPAAGLADDAAKKARPLEPDTGDETGFAAPANDDATYGNLNGDDGYYNADGDADYTSYSADHEPWLDAKAYFASEQYYLVINTYNAENVFPAPNGGNADDRTATPGKLWVGANLGAWHDDNGDGWIGNLEETGRPTSSDAPYADGRVDDPNDYSDSASNTASDPVKQDAPEWKSGGSDAVISATIKPVCDDGDKVGGQCPWGSTDPPVGVYVVKDRDDQNYNPYDDVAEDVTGFPGPKLGPVDPDEGERLSDHRQYGPIDVTFRQHPNVEDNGRFRMQQNIITPTGTLDYPVKITVDGELGSVSSQGGADLTGEPITDVDYLEPSVAGE